jgi:hypothetical protein
MDSGESRGNGLGRSNDQQSAPDAFDRIRHKTGPEVGPKAVLLPCFFLLVLPHWIGIGWTKHMIHGKAGYAALFHRLDKNTNQICGVRS